jgi:hypothetical protein
MALWFDEIWTARLGGQIGYGTARKGKVVWHASSEHWPHSEGSVFLLETCVQAGVACRRRLLGHDQTLDMDIRACVGGLAWVMPATECPGGGENIATARRNTICHICRRWRPVEQDEQRVDAVASSNGGGSSSRRYAPICGAATGDPCRSQTPSKWCSGGGGGLPEATWTGATECGPAALVRIRHKRQHAGTAQGLGYEGRR